jgi:outer membrane protein OmpA-like peptidoglycan-associated protein
MRTRRAGVVVVAATLIQVGAPAALAQGDDGRVTDIERRTTTLLRRVESISGDIRVAETPEQVEVVLAVVLFVFDSATLTPAAEARLVEAAATLTAEGEGPVQVVGHTDSMGTDAYNVHLSQRRAAAVRDALARLAPDFTYQVSGKGESEPAAPNTNADGSDNPEGRARNRRVAIALAKTASQARQRARYAPVTLLVDNARPGPPVSQPRRAGRSTLGGSFPAGRWR